MLMLWKIFDAFDQRGYSGSRKYCLFYKKKYSLLIEKKTW
jgi:hypothetical protein